MDSPATEPSPATPEPASPPPARASRRPWWGVVLVAVAVGLFLGRAAFRGTHVEECARDPASASDGVVRQLLLDGERKVVRLALVVEQPSEQVWGTIVDYARYHELFGNLDGPIAVTAQPDGRARISGEARLGPLAWPFQVTLTTEEAPGRRVLRWDEPSAGIPVNRGSWTLTEPAPGRTLVVYTLDLEVAGYPGWLVRYVSLNRLRSTLRSVADEAARRAR